MITGRDAELSLLTLTAGVAGLSYELLYARLLGQYLGEAFHVRGAVLAVFLLGIALGSWLTPRVRRFLPGIQCGLGTFALAIAAIHTLAFDSLVTHVVPIVSTSPAVTLAVVALLLAAPSIAIGVAVPLFAERLTSRQGYATSYGLYNVGAALSILAIEYLVLRAVGLTITLVLVGALDVLIGLRLWSHAPPTQAATRAAESAPDRAKLFILAAAGFVASVYQMFALKQAQIFWGPFSETFALHLFVVIAAIGATSLVLARWKVSFGRWLTAIACGLPLAMLLPSVLLSLYPVVVENAASLPRALWQVAFFCGVFLPPFVLIAGMLPSFWASHPDQRGWRALTANSLGNAAGFASYMLLVHPLFGDLAIALGIALGFGILAAAYCRKIVVALCIVPILGLALGFDGRHMQMSFRDFYSPRAYAAARSPKDQLETIRVFDNTLVHRTAPNGSSSATVDGHRTLRIHGRHGNVAELLHGVLPLGYVRERGRALSIGVGTGISTGALAESFSEVTAVEISPAVLEALARFGKHNFGLLARDDVELILGDGMTHLYQQSSSYDAIISTVDGPFYRSSSKLYSREFFALARSRLRPHGVYAFWLDQAYSRSVNETIIATAREVFDVCHATALNGGYVQIVCSPSSLVWTPIQDLSPRLRTSLEPTVPDFERAHPLFYFGDTALTRSPGNVPINTLDRPVLEFARTLHVRSQVSLLSVLGMELDAGPNSTLSDADVFARCELLSATGGAPLECAQVQAPQL